MEDERLLIFSGKSYLQVNRNGNNSCWLKKTMFNLNKIDKDSFYFTYNGKILQGNDPVFAHEKFRDSYDELVIRCHPRIPGGKGGFGSMLRALGAQIEKTTNREACRDLSGRRMRDVNNEKQVSEWLEKEKKDKEERAKKKKEKLERILNPPKHRLEDSTYVEEIKNNAEKVEHALRQGFEKVTSSRPSLSSLGKRENKTETERKAKKRKMWSELDEVYSSSDNESASENLDEIASPIEKRSSVTESTANAKVETENGKENIKCEKEFVEEQNDKVGMPAIELKNTEIEDVGNPNMESVSTENTKQVSAEYSKGSDSENKQVQQQTEEINLKNYSTAEELEAHGLDVLKAELSKFGLKCGGTLQQRAQRLFLLKDTPLDKLDASLFAKPKKGRNNRNK